MASLASSPVSGTQDVEKRAKRRRKRKMLLQELIHTEETYVAALQKLVYDFIEPLHPSTVSNTGGAITSSRSNNNSYNNSNTSNKSNASASATATATTTTTTTNSSSSTMFVSDHAMCARSVLRKKYGARGLFQGMNAREICGLNQYLLADLKRIITPIFSTNVPTTNTQNKHVDAQVAHLFLRYTPQMAMYSVYCESHQTMLERIEVARDSDCVNAYFSEIELQSKCSLQSLLIQPVQRLPRYRMLLFELIKNSQGESSSSRSASSSSSSPLQQALDAISDIAQRVNEQLRAFEERKKVFSLSRRIVGSPNLIAPSRTFIRSGMLMKVSRARRSRPYHFFLFSDGALVYASPVTPAGNPRAGNSSNKKSSPRSWSATEQDREKFTFRRKLTVLDVKRRPHSASFRLTGTPKSISVCASSVAEADEWCMAFQVCFQSLLASPMWSHGRRQSVKSRAKPASRSVRSGSNTFGRMGPTARLGDLRSSSSATSSPWNLEARSKS
jgi:hypothetical protein